MKLGLFGVLVGIIVEVLQLVGRKEPAAAVRMQLREVTIPTGERAVPFDARAEVEHTFGGRDSVKAGFIGGGGFFWIVQHDDERSATLGRLSVDRDRPPNFARPLRLSWGLPLYYR